MANVNQVTLIGRLTRDPELRYTTSGTAVTEVSLAVNEEWVDAAGEKKKEVNFFDVTIWARRAEVFCQYMKKGREVFVSGKLKQDRWQTEDGQNRSKVKVTANDVQFLGGKDRDDNGGGERRAPRDEERPPDRTAPARAASPRQEEWDDTEEDVPF